MSRLALAALLCFGSAAVRAAPDFLIEVEIAPSAVYVGGETILRQRLLRAPGIPYGVVRPPVLGDAAEIWPLGRLRWYEVRRDGMTWQVHERAYLILPRRAGRFEVSGSELEGPLRRALASGERAPSSGGDPRGPRVQLVVRPPPADAGEPWLPARSLLLEESWSQEPATLSVGTPMVRTVILRVEGLPAKRLPALQRLEHPALRVHHEPPELATEHREDGTAARMVQRVVLIPLDEAEVLLPEVAVRWWDVRSDEPRVATLPARTLRLQAPAAVQAVEPVAVPATDFDALVARLAAAAFALLLVAGLWWHARTHARRDARRKLREACLRDDARSARDALVEWWSSARPGVPRPLLQRMGEAWSAPARAELRALDAALYGRRRWDGRKFWRSVRPSLRAAPHRAAPRRPPRMPFFRLQAGAAIPGADRRWISGARSTR